MRVKIVANCQGASVAACAQAMVLGLDAEFISFTDISNGTSDLLSMLRECDCLFGQPFVANHVPAEFAHKVFYFPSIAFPAYHPDMAYVRGVRFDGDGKFETVTNVMIMYHSRIALAGYVQGLDLDRILALYTPHTFARLGYFDAWRPARDDLMKEGMAAGMPLGAHIDRWSRGGCFMYSMNHPHLRVMVDLTRDVLTRAGIPIENHNVSDHVADPLKKLSVWPIYPALAERLDLFGDYQFVRPMDQGTITLREFVKDSLEQFAQYETSTLQLVDGSLDQVRDRIFGNGGPKDGITAGGNPYRTGRPEQFWTRSVAGVGFGSLSPMLSPRFTVGKNELIATAGSCFAQHIARVLSESGYNYFVAEQRPAAMATDEAFARNYDIFSARYGNVYTARQMLQLVRRAEGTFAPLEDFWTRADGRLVDPFRPQIEPDGFVDLDKLHRSRAVHLEAVRRMLREMNVFVFTLGMTEGWRSKLDGAVFPLAPGVCGGVCDFERHEFINFDVEETVSDLQQMLDMLSVLNPNCRVILTVSPVPLIATYEPRHALVATTYSKAVLRAAVDAIRRSRQHVEYFPSYEIVTGAYTRGAYFEDDLRSVTEEGVAHVMRIFMSQLGVAEPKSVGSAPKQKPDAVAPGRRSLFALVCDERAIADV